LEFIMASEKVLYPVGVARTSPTPIHREAREAAERAIDALRELNREDPFVFAALGWAAVRGLVLDGSKRDVMAWVREETHRTKVRAVQESVRAIPSADRTIRTEDETADAVSYDPIDAESAEVH
jgi:hypothetical protein